MIKSFTHKGLQRFFKDDDAPGIQAQHAPRLRRLLDALDEAQLINDLDVPGWHLHGLRGDKKGLWSLRVSGNWRMTFKFEDGDAEIVNVEDYH
ncbi:MAG: type II toxin-antitoxin system RelE/ParE family toxin [Burkholderiales bacterium]